MRAPLALGLALALAAVGALRAPGSPASADDVFLDGFDAGTFCAWSFPPTGFEVAANGLDDDCDGAVDEPDVACDAGLPSNSSDPLQYAAAIHLGQTTTESGHLWGVVSGSLTLATGLGTPASVSRPIRPSRGASNFAGGGTGWLAVRGNVDPGENVTLRIAIWDTEDGRYDSLVLLDAFRWSLDPVEPGADQE